MREQQITLVLDGGGEPITPSNPEIGRPATIHIPGDCRITFWGLEADQPGSIVVDVLRNGRSIVGDGYKPMLSDSKAVGPVEPMNWTSTELEADDVISFAVRSAERVKRVNVILVLEFK